MINESAELRASLRAGPRAAAVISLVPSARLNWLDRYVYLKDLLQRLPTRLARDVALLLPSRWTAGVSNHAAV